MSYNKETGMYEGYIYKIVNNVNGKIYIGQTRQTLKERWKGHKYDVAHGDLWRSYIHSSMRKYGIDNFHIEEIVKIKNVNENDLITELNELEKYYIKCYKTTDTKFGYNITSGGDNNSPYLKIKVKQYRFDGKLLKIWDSIIDAASKLSLLQTGISSCCNGYSYFCGDYVWRYVDDSFEKFQITNCALSRVLSKYKIKQYDKNGLLLNTYNKKDLIKLYGKSGYRRIILVCLHQKKLYKNYIWKHEFDDSPVETIKKNTNNKNYKIKKTYKKSNRHKMDKKKSKGTALLLGREENGHIKPKPVNCYTKDDKFVFSFKSIDDAGKYYNLKNPYNITLVCQNKRQYAANLKWYYANDLNQPDKTKIIA